jgi:uncharacterized membrane protein YedE/YeeE
MKAKLSALAAGLLFGMGLMLSGMTNPGEVLCFLDWSGFWSPDLIGVLGSAVVVSLIGFQFARSMERPWFEAEFPALPKKSVDRPLFIGALIFGIGWGLAGYCPGPALAGLALGNDEVFVFLGAMLIGGLLQQRWARRRKNG